MTPRRRPSLLGAVAVALALLSGAARVGAQGEALHPRIERACLRIPNLQTRTDNLLKRLQGDASTIGSLAWLQVQIDNARAAGRAPLATALDNRLAVRTQSVQVLQARQSELVQLAQTCADYEARS
jgi:hypothetical protein